MRCRRNMKTEAFTATIHPFSNEEIHFDTDYTCEFTTDTPLYLHVDGLKLSLSSPLDITIIADTTSSIAEVKSMKTVHSYETEDYSAQTSFVVPSSIDGHSVLDNERMRLLKLEGNSKTVICQYLHDFNFDSSVYTQPKPDGITFWGFAGTYSTSIISATECSTDRAPGLQTSVTATWTLPTDTSNPTSEPKLVNHDKYLLVATMSCIVATSRIDMYIQYGRKTTQPYWSTAKNVYYETDISTEQTLTLLGEVSYSSSSDTSNTLQVLLQVTRSTSSQDSMRTTFKNVMLINLSKLEAITGHTYSTYADFKADFPDDYYSYSQLIENAMSTTITKIVSYDANANELDSIELSCFPLTLKGVENVHDSLTFENNAYGSYDAILTTRTEVNGPSVVPLATPITMKVAENLFVHDISALINVGGTVTIEGINIPTLDVGIDVQFVTNNIWLTSFYDDEDTLISEVNDVIGILPDSDVISFESFENLSPDTYKYLSTEVYSDYKDTLIFFGSKGLNPDGTANFVEDKESYASNQEGVACSLTQRLSVIKGELWYNVTKGLPLFDKGTSSTSIDTYVASTIMSHPDVINILSFSSFTEQHSYKCDVKVMSRYGEIELSI